MTDTTQAVVDKDKAAATQAAASDTSARTTVDPLDELLAQFDREATTTTAEQPPAQQHQTDTAALKDQIKAELAAEARAADDFSGLIKRVRGDVSEKVFNDKELGKWLDGLAEDDPALRNAWINRSKNPAVWKRIEAEISNKLSQKWDNRIDPNATEDREIVAHSMRGASSTKVPDGPSPRYGAMSDRELREHVRKEYGYDPGF